MQADITEFDPESPEDFSRLLFTLKKTSQVDSKSNLAVWCHGMPVNPFPLNLQR